MTWNQVRWTGLALYVAAVILLVAVNWPKRAELLFHEALARISLLLVFSGGAVATWDALREHRDGGWGLYVVSGAVALFDLGLATQLVHETRGRRRLADAIRDHLTDHGERP